MEDNLRTNTGKDPEGFTNMGGRGKGGGRKYQNNPNEYKLPSRNSFEILEEEGGNNGKDNAPEINPIEKEKEDIMEIIHENSEQKENLPNNMELGRDHEMTPSEIVIEDHELQEILDREHLDLEGFLK